jgi:hypothetical protein
MLHDLSAKDYTSFLYGHGKKTAWKAQELLQFPGHGQFAEQDSAVNQDVIDQSRRFFMTTYGRDDFDDLAYTFQNNSGDLKTLQPTENAFLNHAKKNCLATIVYKTAHIPKLKLPTLMTTDMQLMLHDHNNRSV